MWDPMWCGRRRRRWWRRCWCVDRTATRVQAEGGVLRFAVGVAAGVAVLGPSRARARMLHTLHGSSGHTSCMPIYKFAAPDYKIRARQPDREKERARERESERERQNVWLCLWPERSKFVAMTHDYVDHYDASQARQAILIMMIEKPFARPDSLERCQWLEINCPSIAQKDNNNNCLECQNSSRRTSNTLRS